MFDFKTESSSTKLLVDFTQAYYTVDVDVPGRPSDLFAPEVTVDDLARSMGEGNPPMYVQSITFGRRAVLSVESDRTSEEVTAALDLTLNALIDASLQLDMHTRSIIDSLEMKVFVLGGAGEAGVKSIEGFDGLVKYIQEGADYSASSPGAPIAYKLAYLDNMAAEFAYTTDYAEAKCLSEVTLRVRAESLDFPSNGEGKGQGEMTWGVWAKSGAQSCELSRQDKEMKISDGETVNIQNSCDFKFRIEDNPSIQIGMWATEHGGFLDSSKTADSSRSYTFDAKVGQWNPIAARGSTAPRREGRNRSWCVPALHRRARAPSGPPCPGRQASPPVARMFWPVSQRASGLARKAIRSAMSAGRPRRARGVIATACASASGELTACSRSVSTAPGETALTVILRAASSHAATRVTCSSAALLEA